MCPSVWPSVRPSVTSRSSVETAEQMELIFGMGASFDITLNCVIRKFGYTSKNKVLPSGTLRQTLNLENFLPRQVDRAVNKTRRQSSLLITLTTVELVVAGCRKFLTCHVGYCNPVTPLGLYFFCSGFAVQLFPTLLCSSWQNFD